MNSGIKGNFVINGTFFHRGILTAYDMFELQEERIRSLLKRDSDYPDRRDILNEISPENPAGLEEISSLIHASGDQAGVRDAVIRRADALKRQIYGNKIKLFVPVYVSNVCVNECLYCAYRAPNKDMPRRTLSVDEFRREVREVARMGYRVIEIVTSESPVLRDRNLLPEYIAAARDVLDKTDGKENRGEIILMSWALSDEEFRDVRDAGLDSFYLWQETYDRDVYARVHPENSPKADFRWRAGVFDRAIQSGIRKVGLGALFGLGDWKFDLLSLTSHGNYLQREYGVTPDAIGIPRFKYAEGAVMKEAENMVSDDDLRLAVALYRLAFPYSHVFLNTREKMKLLMELLKGGGSEMNIACAVYPGGYTMPRKDRQFDFYSYPTEKTVDMLKEQGYEVTHFSPEVRATG